MQIWFSFQFPVWWSVLGSSVKMASENSSEDKFETLHGPSTIHRSAEMRHFMRKFCSNTSKYDFKLNSLKVNKAA